MISRYKLVYPLIYWHAVQIDGQFMFGWSPARKPSLIFMSPLFITRGHHIYITLIIIDDFTAVTNYKASFLTKSDSLFLNFSFLVP